MLKYILSRAYAGLANASAGPTHSRSSRNSRLLLGLGAFAAGTAGPQAAAGHNEENSHQLPTDKLACHTAVPSPRTPTILVSCGSFNPPTVMHLRMFDLATVALAQRGHDVWGCYMSPVADEYGKKGLAAVQHRLQMCQLAAADTSNVMVSDWEAQQQGYTRTLQVLRHVSESLALYLKHTEVSSSSITSSQQATVHAAGLQAAAAARKPSNATTASNSNPPPSGNSSNSTGRMQDFVTDGECPSQQPQPRVMLLCGADLLATIAQPGVWKDPDIILRDFGIVCICREGTDVEQLLGESGSLLQQYKHNIVVVEEPVLNLVSSTKVRGLLAAGQPVRYLVSDAVIAYIKQCGLYT